MRQIKKILVPLDGSTCSRRALDMAISLSRGKETAITGMHVIRIPMVFTNKIKRQARQYATKIMAEALRDSKKQGVPFRSKISSDGYAGKEIVQFAKNNEFDLIVMGSRGPHPIAEMFLGSVANYVLTKSKIPVMIVR
ncbi:MAG: universal stress protein [Candidatus Nitrosotenuis sp.]